MLPPDIPIVDAWANPIGMNIPEVSRLFQQSHASPTLLTQPPLTPAQLIALMDASSISQILLSSWRRPNHTIFSNADIATYTRAYPTRIFGLASVDLLDPVSAVADLHHYIVHEHFVGLRVVNWLWNLPPTDAHYWPLYVKCIELDVPFCTQVGHTGPLCPSETGRPIPYIDTIALKFPQLKIVCGHIGFPWTAEMVGVAWKHENVFIDTSAWLPKYYPEELVTFANTTGKEKVLFGTNFPQLTWEKCVESVERDLLREEKGGEGVGRLRKDVLKAFMGGNARRVFKLPEVDVARGEEKLKAVL